MKVKKAYILNILTKIKKIVNLWLGAVNNNID